MKELPITPVTAIATIAIVLLAVIISNIKIDVVREPGPHDTRPTHTAGGEA